MKGTVDVLVPTNLEVDLTQNELYDFIKHNFEFIIWDTRTKPLVEQYELH